jgi:selenocysteine lyase/cysteine desulfurase
MDGFKGVEGIELLTPRDDILRGSMVTIRHHRADAAKFFGYLLKEHRLRCRPVTEQGLEAVRISMHVFNSHDDCARILASVRAATRIL